MYTEGEKDEFQKTMDDYSKVSNRYNSSFLGYDSLMDRMVDERLRNSEEIGWWTKRDECTRGKALIISRAYNWERNHVSAEKYFRATLHGIPIRWS